MTSVAQHRLSVYARLSCVVLAIVASATPRLLAQQGSVRRDDQLIYAVYLTRHGVRSPTATSEQYNQFSSSPWPTWNVPPGYLTPHGYELMKLFGIYDRERLARLNLIKPAGCEDASHVAIHADSDQRTRETAKALAEGMFPGCRITIHSQKEGTNDPLFHLLPGSISPAEATLGTTAVLARVGNDLSEITRSHQARLAALDSLLATCGAFDAAHVRTSIFDIPASVSSGQGDHIVNLRGPLNTAGTLTENFLLEYTQAMPARDVGWGCINGKQLRDLINLHTDAADLAQRTPAVAVPQASQLLRVIHRSIQQAITGKATPGSEGRPGDKVLLLVGHDTNLLNVAGALNLNWWLDGRRDDTPPGSSLVFEVWKNRVSGAYSIRVFFTSQTLEQMRNASPLTEENPPPKTIVSVRMCSRKQEGYDLSCFAHALERASSVRHPSS